MTNKIKITLRKSNGFFDSSSYRPSTKEIVVLDGSDRAGSLYHEYRHHIQYKILPNWFLIWATLGRITLYLHFVLYFICLLLFSSKYIAIVAISQIILCLPTLLMELDANVFAIKRIYKKKVFLKNISQLLVSIITYVYLLIGFQTYLIITYL